MRVGLASPTVNSKYFSHSFCKSALSEITVCSFLIVFLENESCKVVRNILSTLLTIAKYLRHQVETLEYVEMIAKRKIKEMSSIGGILYNGSSGKLSRIVSIKMGILFYSIERLKEIYFEGFLPN